jgi:hypothetical protein
MTTKNIYISHVLLAHFLIQEMLIYLFNAPLAFQRYMTLILRIIEKVMEVFMDDLFSNVHILVIV